MATSQYQQQQFKQETISLLRQQSNKMKLLNAQLSSKQEQVRIKQEQIKFLKQTVIELQGQNELVCQQKEQLRIKLDKIIEEIKVYNEQIVKPICVERELLRKENKECKEALQQSQNQLKLLKDEVQRSNKLRISLQKQLEKLRNMIKQHQITSLEQQQEISKYTTKAQKAQQQILKLNRILTQETKQKQKLNVELGTVNKQLNNVINKYNITMKDYQQKLKDIQSTKVDQTEITRLQQQIKSKQKEISHLKQENAQINLHHQQYKLKSLTQREKLSKQFTKSKLTYEDLKTDISNLKKSIEIKRKVIEFQSQQSEIFYQIYTEYQKLFNANQELLESSQQLQDFVERLKLENQKLSQQGHNKEIQQTLIKTHFQQLLERLESQYQGKLLSLNLKIRHQEEALQRIKKNEQQMIEHNQSLQSQLISTTQDFTAYKSTTEQSLNKLNQENYKIVQEMQQLYTICNENLNNKRTLDKIKHVTHSLLIALYFMEKKIVENHHKEVQLYLPMMEGFLTLRKQILCKNSSNSLEIQQKDFSFVGLKKDKKLISKSKHMLRIKKVICAVIATIRLTKLTETKSLSSKHKNQLTGLPLLVIRSLETRNKIPNMVELLQKQSQVFEKSQQIQQVLIQLLKVTHNAFTWPQNKFQKLQIHTDKYITLLKSTESKININHEQ